MKNKELWISEHGGGASIDWDGPPNYTKDYYSAGHKVHHARLVDPAFDAIVLEMVEILALMSEGEGNDATLYRQMAKMIWTKYDAYNLRRSEASSTVRGSGK